MLAFDSIPFVFLKKKKLLPEISAIYIATDKKNNPLYVGMSRNVKKRWVSHSHIKILKKNKLKKIYWIPCVIDNLRKTESEYIKLLDPKIQQRKENSFFRTAAFRKFFARNEQMLRNSMKEWDKD